MPRVAKKTAPAAPRPPRDEPLEGLLSAAFADYGLSVLHGRALPSAYDGLKPVQRRILWAAWTDGLKSSGRHQKSARLVGSVMGRLHPHGDAAIYDAAVRMAQPWSNNAPLMDGQGNFGSVNGDPAAAYRYSEIRLSAFSEEALLEGAAPGVVPFRKNYDGTEEEPETLPASLPLLLVNGASGIGVAYATDVPPCNLAEVCRVAAALVTDPGSMTDEEVGAALLPDPPTGGVLCSPAQAAAAMATGAGSYRVRASVSREKNALVVSEAPWTVDVSQLADSVAEAGAAGLLPGFRSVRNETSKKNGVRLVVELSPSADPAAAEEALYARTKAEVSCKVNMVATAGASLGQWTARELVLLWAEGRRRSLRARLCMEVGEAVDRIHLLEGLLAARPAAEEVARVVRDSADPREGLVGMGFTRMQADHVLESRIRRLSSLDASRAEAELASLRAGAEARKALLRDPAALDAEIASALLGAASRFGGPRRCRLPEGSAGNEKIDAGKTGGKAAGRSRKERKQP